MKICIAFQSIAANEMNGDFILQKKIAGGTLVLLADGMGGLDFPEQASKIVCEAILDYFESYNASVPSKIIQESLEYADKTLRKACYQRKCKMGTALTLVYLTDSFLYYTSLGDVRLYHEHINGTITLLTSDDVINIGGKSYLTVCINGRGYRAPIEVYQMSVQTGDRFILCSDGFYKKYDVSEYLQQRTSSPLQCTEDDCSVVEINIK